ncbi:hypothetical protein LQ939_03465 [Pantoea alhagi]|uniref:hypothetical protein n=1 Tax=Pantoea alhagi TaxID=1891675 RepID=UPI00202B7838|nr:hypothetical protein [Pantoea alhagi]URQ61414.1 hypothetical protein LQ939_03465 [Pantoea alhagi]
MTDILMSPEDVHRNIFIGNPRYADRGNYAIIFKVSNEQKSKIYKPDYSDYEFIHEGRLKIDEVIHSGGNPYKILTGKKYDERLRLINVQVKSRKNCK